MEGQSPKFKQHLRENRKVYLVGTSCLAAGASIGAFVVFRHFGGIPLEISQTAKNQALVIWKPEINQIALVKKACPEPKPVMDKITGEAYASMNRAAKMTGEAISAITKDAQGTQTRWELLPVSVLV